MAPVSEQATMRILYLPLVTVTLVLKVSFAWTPHHVAAATGRHGSQHADSTSTLLGLDASSSDDNDTVAASNTAQLQSLIQTRDILEKEYLNYVTEMFLRRLEDLICTEEPFKEYFQKDPQNN